MVVAHDRWAEPISADRVLPASVPSMDQVRHSEQWIGRRAWATAPAVARAYRCSLGRCGSASIAPNRPVGATCGGALAKRVFAPSGTGSTLRLRQPPYSANAACITIALTKKAFG